jgi:predicted metalloprotease
MGGGQQEGTAVDNCESGADANRDDACRIEFTEQSLDYYWSGLGPTYGFDYTEPRVVVFDGATNTGCGNASTAVGPFYCPPDQTIYLDTAFYQTLRTQFGASAGPLAQEYILAHEFGHHIQHLLGTTEGLDLQDTGAASDSVRLELQADCFAGAWVAAASTTVDDTGNTFLQPVTAQQVADALNAASSVGDDSIQETTQGQSNPETWTHGSSEQRQKWFQTGYEGGPDACTTFQAAPGDL